MGNEVPPELRCLAVLIDQEPPNVREAFQFLMAVALEESGKAESINVAQVDAWVIAAIAPSPAMCLPWSGLP